MDFEMLKEPLVLWRIGK